MKKTIFALAALAALAMACAKEQQPSDTPAAQDGVTVLKVSVAPTKVAVNETTGACTWQSGDRIAMWFQTADAGKRVEFTLQTLNDDGTAIFITTDEIPTGTYTKVRVAHPTGSIKSDGNFGMVTEYDYEEGKVPMYIRAESDDVTAEESAIKIEGDIITALLSQNGAIMKFTLHDVPSYATGFVVHANRRTDNTGTNFKMITRFPCKSGVDKDLVIYSPVPGGTYPLDVYLIDSGNELIDGTTKKFNSATYKQVQKGDYIIMPEAIDFDSANLPVRNYVNINGVKFAKGNLQYVKDAGQTGFQDGWRIAPAQWHHLAYKLLNSTTGNTTSYDGSERVDIRTTNSSDAFEHFNGGGIGANSRLLNDYITPSSTSAFEMSGKVYSDVTAETILTGDDQFVATGTLYGDVAFWASKGVWRMPKASELKYLHNETHKISAKYVTSDGYTVWGWFFYPIVAEDRIQGDNKITITDKDLEYGLFLPNAGRRAEQNESVIFYITKQGSYRTGTYIKYIKSNDDSKFYSAYYHSNDGAGYLYDDKLYGSNQNISSSMSHKAAYSIRPVLVD